MKYRKEIDGLRAFAVIPVILFHAGFDFIPGGFVGVDIFFVISGYLITYLILKDLDSGTFKFLDFYERRARRILPALFFVMLLCIPFSVAIFTERDLISFAKSLIAISFFSSNMFFWGESGYFDADAELKPLLHTWSLSVEEQFYIFFPLILIFFRKYKFFKLIFFIFSIFLMSLLLSNWAAYEKPSAAFFLIFTRAWELLLGAFAGILLFYKNNFFENKRFFGFFGFFGFLLIISSFLFFSEKLPLPGFFTLIPTLGALLIILFSNNENYIGKFLGFKFFVYIGLFSYSAYLFHQPLFAFTRYFNVSEPSWIQLISICFLSFLCAYFSWKFIEQPFRDKTRFSRRYIFLFAISGMFLFSAIACFLIYSKIFSDDEKDISSQWKNSFENVSVEKLCEKNFDIYNQKASFCRYGELTEKPSIAFFGDSHSSVIIPLMDKIAKENKISAVHAGIGGCPPLLGIDVFKGAWNLGVCKELSKKQFEYVKENGINYVFLVARWSLYATGDYGKGMRGSFLVSADNSSATERVSNMNLIKGLEDTIEAYKEIGVNVIILDQVPQQKNYAQIVYKRIFFSDSEKEKKQDWVKRFSVDYKENNKLQENHRKAFDTLNNNKLVKIINFDSDFCSNQKCMMGDYEKSYYIDNNHLNFHGAMKMEKAILEKINFDSIK